MSPKEKGRGETQVLGIRKTYSWEGWEEKKDISKDLRKERPHFC